MKILYKLVRSKKHKGRLFSALLSFLFFIGMVGLYSGLGTFVSSCGTVTFVSSNLYVGNHTGSLCSPFSYGNYADLQTSVSYGWRVNLKIFNGNTIYSQYNFGPSTSSSSATLDGHLIKGVQIPQNAAYNVSILVISPCHCPYSNVYSVFSKQSTSVYNSGDIVDYIGILGAPGLSSCN